VRFQTTISSVVLGFVISTAVISGCSSNDETSSEATSTSLAPTTSLAPATTSTTSTTTTTIYAGPPTLAPGASLPVPEPLPPENAVEPEIIIGEIVIPALMVSQTIYQGMSLPTLDKGVGYWPGTAMPGYVGNVVLGGHRVSKKKPFRNIDQLVPGDEIYLTTSDGTFVYAVTEQLVVEPTETWIINQTDSATLTLFACHPPHSTKQRLIVFADYLRKETV
jgi:sortase A